jgi:hypothetical protein
MKPNIKVRKSTIPEVPDTFHDTSIKFNQSLEQQTKEKRECLVWSHTLSKFRETSVAGFWL